MSAVTTSASRVTTLASPVFATGVPDRVRNKVERNVTVRGWDRSFVEMTKTSYKSRFDALLEDWRTCPDHENIVKGCKLLQFTLTCPLLMATNLVSRSSVVRSIDNLCQIRILSEYPEIGVAINDTMDMLKIYSAHPLWVTAKSFATDACATHHYITYWVSANFAAKEKYDKTHMPAPWGATPRANATAYVRA